MSRIILQKYDNGEQQFVVGWDHPCASFFWQHFNKEPEVAESGEGKWKVTSPSHKVRVYDTKQEAEHHQWDDWEEMVAYKGYWLNELPNMQAFMDSLPDAIKALVTEDVQELLRAHAMDPGSGNNVVDMTKSNVVMGSYKIEVMVFDEEKWGSNALRFATEQEAKESAIDLEGRWTMVKEWRVVSSPDPVNYKWDAGRAVKV